MKIHLFFLITSIFFFINTECFSQNEQSNCTFKNGTISKGEKNIGRDLTVTYDRFFNKYTFRFKNSSGFTEKITFEGVGSNSTSYVCSKDRLTYTHVALGIGSLCKYGPKVISFLRFFSQTTNGKDYYIANYR